MVRRYGVQMMLHLNLWASLLLAALVALTGQLAQGLSFCSANPRAVYYIVLASLSMAAGQNFIFYTLTHFDALTLATITTTRKFVTIVVSTLYYQHRFGQRQQVGVALVFLGLVLELVNKYSEKQLRKSQQGEAGAGVQDKAKAKAGKSE